MVIAFDLDGTISDPIIGIAAAINHALEGMNLPGRIRPDLKSFIGPPLTDIFADLLDTDDPVRIKTAVNLFREQYMRLGYKQNTLYPGMAELLEKLSGNGHSLYIATNKKTRIAHMVADHFLITRHFKRIFGSGANRTKQDMLNEIQTLEPSSHPVMIGDRLHDIQAGKAAGFYCIGVLWGYGSRKELLAAGANALCPRPDDLETMLPRPPAPHTATQS